MKKYLYKVSLEIKSPVYVKADTVIEAEEKAVNKAVIIITNLNRKEIGSKKWFFKEKKDE